MRGSPDLQVKDPALQGQERKDGIGEKVREKAQKWRKRKVGGREREGHRESQNK